ncbi:uncharacterized protein LOC132282609 isoform X2 [Cornus florida]|uniref:uncharacterized protein LOC132282609 isoform X2 n=1 Tax=Cornus florida TaxID=4283 RepID=UPI00289DDB26|nr:uncharacterized protein LOC132282609 isoform X2 [Cornus florida]
MQGGRGGRDPFSGSGDPFAALRGFSGFGGQRSLLSSFLGGRDPFDDTFFTRPFGSMFESNIFGPSGSPFGPSGSPFGPSGSPFGPSGSPFADSRASGFLEHQGPQTSTSRGPIIEELDSDGEKDEEGKEENKDNPRKHGRSSKDPYYVEDPDDAERKSKQMQHRNDFNRLNNARSQPQTHTFTFQSSTVTYGGANGANYTSSKTRRIASDGLTFEERKEADTASGQATHNISRGIYDKGHSVTRKLNSDGRVDTMQMLHNLNEDELGGFEDAWNRKARKHLPGWTEGANVITGSDGNEHDAVARRGGWALPSTERAQHSGIMKPDVGQTVGSSRSKQSGKMKADTRVRKGSSSVRAGAANGINMDQVSRH